MNAQSFAPEDSISALVRMIESDLGSFAGPFWLLVQFRVREGTELEIPSLFESARSLTLKDRGCIAFDLNQHAVDCNRFSVVEQWKSIDDLDAHLRTGHTTTLRNALNGLIEGLPHFTVLVAPRSLAT
jgi:quinol monooxygenase YgiN